jgi:glycine/D-amino acid oxidase-like deaminating enzyme
LHYDYIIVGQGIAGTVLSWTLLQQGKKVLVVDSREKPNSSEIALGIYNPVVFKRMTKSWKADELIPVAENLYTEMEAAFGIKALHKDGILKVFSSKDERTFWEKKMHNGEAMAFLDKTKEQSQYTSVIIDDLGSADVLSSGWLDTAKLLSAYRKFLSGNNLLRTEKFEYAQLVLTKERLEWNDISADKLIFCEGSRATDNSFFKNLPFVLTKGEMLTIRIPDFLPQHLISKGVYLLHEYDDIFKVGATYDWDDLTDIPTEKGKQDLVEKLKKVLKTDYEILDHAAAIRPTVKDRRPLIGLHPEEKHIGIFNGMGTKGVMIAPFFAKQFTDHIESGLPLDKEVDIKRFSN